MHRRLSSTDSARILFPVLILLLVAGLAQANPLEAAARDLGRRGLPAGEPPDISPTRFRPSGVRVAVGRFVNECFDDPEDRDAIGESLLRSLADYEEAAAGTKAQNDASAALAYAVCVLWSTAGGKALDDAAFRALIGRFQAAFDTPALRGAGDLQKQDFYERALCAAGLAQIVARAVDSPAGQTGLRTLARRQLRALIGTEVERIDLDGPRVAIRGTAPVVEALPPSAAFTFTAPPGWTSEAGWQIHRAGATAACVRLLPLRPAAANIGTALRDLWLKEVPKELADAYSTMIYRRRVGDGLLAYFVCGAGREAGRKADTLFSVHVVVCGGQWQPVIVALTYDPTAAAPEREPYAACAARAEAFLASFRCPAGLGRGFASRESLVGDYAYGSRAALDGVRSGTIDGPDLDVGGTLSLRADGSYVYAFQGNSLAADALGLHRRADAGVWSVEDDRLLLTPDSGGPRRYRIAGLTQFTAGPKVAVLLSPPDLPANAVTLGRRADWFSTKAK